jgi:poly-gamma-glutamate synthase PgsB/CapB
MGPTVADVARALSNTVPDRAAFFTAEQEHYAIFADRARRAGTRITMSDAAQVTDAEMKGFRYVEHKENVALALAVCQDIGVERGAALAGMYRARPDPGAMRIFRIQAQGRDFELVNTLAANDPDSIAMLWRMTRDRSLRRIVLVNCRADRTDRSRQLAEMCGERIPADHYVATGGMTEVFLRRARAVGIPAERLTDAGDRPVAEVFDTVLRLVLNAERGATEPAALVFATGNIVGYGTELIGYFTARGSEIAY